MCMYIHVCVSGFMFPHVPQSCPAAVAGCCMCRLVGWACLFQAVPPCGRGKKREAGEGRSYTYIFVLPTDFSCCVLSSVRVTPYMGSGPEHSPPSITTDKLISQLGCRPMGALVALLAHAHRNKHAHIYTHPEMHPHAHT